MKIYQKCENSQKMWKFTKNVKINEKFQKKHKKYENSQEHKKIPKNLWKSKIYENS